MPDEQNIAPMAGIKSIVLGVVINQQGEAVSRPVPDNRRGISTIHEYELKTKELREELGAPWNSND